MINKEEAFIKDLKAVMEKYGVEIESEPDYNDEEEPCGDVVYFVSKDFSINVRYII